MRMKKGRIYQIFKERGNGIKNSHFEKREHKFTRACRKVAEELLGFVV